MQYSISLENQEYKITEKTQDKCIKFITDTFDKLHKKRQKQLDDIKELENRIFQKKTATKQNGDEYTAPDFFELYETAKSQLWENLYSDLEGMFDVEPDNVSSRGSEYIQKANLIDHLERCKVKNALDEMIDNLLRKSEAIGFVGWKTNLKQVRRKELVQKIDELTRIPFNVEEIATKEVVEYDGLDIKAVDPCNFVYNKDKNIYIYRTYGTLQSIKENKIYTLSPYQLSELETMAETDKKEDSKINQKTLESRQAVKDGMIEVLEFWGDYKLDSGKYAKNYVIAVIGGKFIARFEANPYINNPFIICEILKDPETDRGYLYFSSVFKLVTSIETNINKQIQALKWIMNPNYLAPQGAFVGEIKLKPEGGTIVEYDPSLLVKEPMPINYKDALVGWDFIANMRSMVESTTGIYKNMSGQIEQQGTTATEIQARVGGQSTRQSKLIDIINQNLIIPVVEKSADLIANTDFEEKEIMGRAKSGLELMTVTNDIKQNQYKYRYSDRGAIQEKRLRIKEVLPVLQNMIPVLQPAGLDVVELSKDILEQLGFENVERYFTNAGQTGQVGVDNIMPNGGQPPMADLQGLPAIESMANAGIPPQQGNFAGIPQGY